MDHLVKRLGNRPYQLEQFSSLRDEALSLMTNIKSGAPFDAVAAEEIIEMLEALASLVDFNVYETFPEFHAELDADAVRRKGPHNAYHIPPATRDVFLSFVAEVQELKGALFAALGKPAICAADAGCARVCQYCDWVLRRTGKGLQGRRRATGSTTLDFSRLLF